MDGQESMVEILKSFERAATQFRPIVLVLPGLALTGLGLFIWLGGLGFRRLLLAVVGALTGAFCALWTAGQNPAAMVLVGLVGAFAAVISQRFFAAALLAVLGGCFAFVFLAWPFPAAAQGVLAGASGAGGGDQQLSVRESLEVARTYSLDMTDALRRAASGLTASEWAIVVAAAFVLLMVGLLFRHLGGALSCSTLGAAMVSVGFVLLLMFKGSGPVGLIERRGALFGSVFLSMIAFGTLEQWILCRRADRRDQGQAAAKGSGSGKKGGNRSWRGR